jgi:hypothetical protein
MARWQVCLQCRTLYATAIERIAYPNEEGPGQQPLLSRRVSCGQSPDLHQVVQIVTGECLQLHPQRHHTPFRVESGPTESPRGRPAKQPYLRPPQEPETLERLG